VRARDLPERTDQRHQYQAEGERHRKAVRRCAGGGLASGQGVLELVDQGELVEVDAGGGQRR